MWGSPEFYLFSLICLRYQSSWTWLCSETLGKFLPAFHGLLFLLKAKYESQTSLNVVAMGLMELTWTHKKKNPTKNPTKTKQTNQSKNKKDKQKNRIRSLNLFFLFSLIWKLKWEMWCPGLCVSTWSHMLGYHRNQWKTEVLRFFFLILTSTNFFLPKTHINSVGHYLLLTTEEVFYF